MPKLVINIENHQQKYTVSEMRRRLAQVLSKLQGDQEVTFSFRASLENYQPEIKPSIVTNSNSNPTIDVHFHKKSSAVFGELARPEND